MSEKHIASRGKQAGKWVNCPALTKCRVGGLHASNEELKATKKYVGKKSVTDLTKEDLIKYKTEVKLATPATAENKPTTNTGLLKEIKAAQTTAVLGNNLKNATYSQHLDSSTAFLLEDQTSYAVQVKESFKSRYADFPEGSYAVFPGGRDNDVFIIPAKDQQEANRVAKIYAQPKNKQPKIAHNFEIVNTYQKEKAGVKTSPSEFLSRDERDVAYGIVHNNDGAYQEVASLTTLNRSTWNYIKPALLDPEVSVPMTVFKIGNEQSNNRQKITVENFPIRGNPVKVAKIMKMISEL